jgi:lysozyme family protein
MAELTEAMLDRLLAHEGGLVDHPRDPGGLTKYGISQRAYPHLDIRALTPAQAKAIYRSDYWEKPGFGAIPDPRLAEQVFDMGVNAGLGRAFRLLHRTMRTPEAPTWTPALRAALDAAVDWTGYRERYLEFRLRYYKALVGKKPKLGVFLKGWTRRATAVARG